VVAQPTRLIQGVEPGDVDEHGQPFEVPEWALPVRMQVGDGPLTVVGWIAANEDLAPLLSNLADFYERLMEERASAGD
jgi:hypothetical protein